MADVLNVLLGAVAAYALVGLLVGIAIAAFGLGRIDPVTRDAPVVFRLMVLPGLVGLWPVMLVKWARAEKGARG